MIFEKGYATQRGSQCILGCLENYLVYRKIDISEAELFFRMKGYELKPSKWGVMIYTISIFGNPEDLDVPYTIITSANREEAKQSLIKCVEDESNVAILMVANKLKYNSAFKYAEDVVIHCVNVIGYDGGDKFFFSDGYIASFKGDMFEGYIAFDDFVDAWEGYNFMHVITDTDKLAEDGYENFKPDLQEISKKQKDNNKILKDYFVSNLKNAEALINTAEYEKSIMSLNSYIRLSGLLTVRSYFREYMEQYFPQTGLAVEYADICKEWNVISCLLIKAAYSDDVSEIEDISGRIESVFVKESEIIDRMAKLHYE